MRAGLLLPMFGLLCIGVFFIYSACFISEDKPVNDLYQKQIVWAAVGFACYAAATLYDYRRMGKWAALLYVLGLVLLVVVLVFGRRIYGARRWLFVPGTGFGVQPSEIAKLATLIMVARLLSLPEVDPRRFGTFVLALALVGLPAWLVMLEPDLGTAMVFVPPALMMMFAAGVPLRYVGTLVATGLLAAGLIVAAIALPGRMDLSEHTRQRIEKFMPLTEYQQERIRVLVWPDRDPLGAGWNKNQSEIAVGSGGLWGKGFLKGTQNILGFLPRSVSHTDFVYSVIAEERGFVGSALVLALYGLIVFFGTQTALNATDRMGRLLCVGVVGMVFTHAWVNIAMTVGVIPITGLPLPLLSYGGSFLVITMLALGIVQSVSVRSPRRLLV